MPSIIRLLLTAAFATSVVVAIMPSLSFADDPAAAEHDRLAAGQTAGVVSPPKSVTEKISGVVASVDERSDTIRIQRSPEMAEELKVQDGLLFSAVRYGDQVDVTVQNIDGTKTIVGLVKR
jgi:Cu/Ag efflux protein CusF